MKNKSEALQLYYWTNGWLSTEPPPLRLAKVSVQPKYIAGVSTINALISGSTLLIVGASQADSLIVAACLGGASAAIGFFMHVKDVQEVTEKNFQREHTMLWEQPVWEANSSAAEPAKSPKNATTMQPA